MLRHCRLVELIHGHPEELPRKALRSTPLLPPGDDGVAFRVALCPAQTVSEFTVTVGAGLTVTVPVAVPLVGQPGKV